MDILWTVPTPNNFKQNDGSSTNIFPFSHKTANLQTECHNENKINYRTIINRNVVNYDLYLTVQ